VEGAVTAAPTKEFPTADVLSAITGMMVPSELHDYPITGVYLVLNWMTGEDVYTHQIPRIGREAAPVVLALHPELQAAVEEAKHVNPDNWREWRQRWLDRYGATITVPKMTIAEHERIDPISELAEMVHPDKIVVVPR
jgi:hypothetical protein